MLSYTFFLQLTLGKRQPTTLTIFPIIHIHVPNHLHFQLPTFTVIPVTFPIIHIHIPNHPHSYSQSSASPIPMFNHLHSQCQTSTSRSQSSSTSKFLTIHIHNPNHPRPQSYSSACRSPSSFTVIHFQIHRVCKFPIIICNLPDPHSQPSKVTILIIHIPPRNSPPYS